VVSLGGTRRRFPGDESGFTLPEVLVAMTMMVTVLFALYALFDTSVRIFRYGGDELEALENARLGLERMEREIRAAYPHDGGVLLDIGGTDGISFQNMPDSGPPRTITYSLSGGPESYLRRNGQRLVGPLDGEEGLRFAYCATPTDRRGRGPAGAHHPQREGARGDGRHQNPHDRRVSQEPRSVAMNRRFARDESWVALGLAVVMVVLINCTI
jgi:prepilin-type N-terminal cleavage/methylation domain-containing protein